MSRATINSSLVGLVLMMSLLWAGLTIAGRSRNLGRQWISVRRGAGSGLTVAAAVSGVFVPQPVVSVPVSEVIVPGAAIAVLQRILWIRRLQARDTHGNRPVDLDEADLATLRRLMEIAGEPATWARGEMRDIPDVLPVDVTRLLADVEMTRTTVVGIADTSDWHLVVRVVGEPVVENIHGVRAQFGKKRAMELLCWMALNKDRSTRSGARNAMWDVTVTDSTFTTIVSDLRRSLGRITPDLPPGYWSPATFTDTLPLGDGLVTDLDVMLSATGSRDIEKMVHALSLVRDTPFAGTNYLWADLDGSTTRAVITVMNLVHTAVEVGTKNGADTVVVAAARAGLRVMPGDEELLQVLSSYL